jgi:hypothetical protein
MGIAALPELLWIHLTGRGHQAKSGWHFEILNQQSNDFLFWQSKTYGERLESLEQIRQEYNSWRYNVEAAETR